MLFGPPVPLQDYIMCLFLRELLMGTSDHKQGSTNDKDWRARLSPGAYAVTREAATERPFSGRYCGEKRSGSYACVCCETTLFDSEAKYDSGTGWPSFFQPVAPGRVVERMDTSQGMARTEVLCASCDSHLGHVFDDGPQPTGLRYCLNSLALVLHPDDGSPPDAAE